MTANRWYNTPNITASAEFYDFHDFVEDNKTASGLAEISIKAENTSTIKKHSAYGPLDDGTYSVTSNVDDLESDGTIVFIANAVDLAGNKADTEEAKAYG